MDCREFCHACKDGGLLLLCELCPRAYHAECLGLKEVPQDVFRCPGHRCGTCSRSGHQAGGMLFSCAACALTACEDHLGDPEKVTPVDVEHRLEAVGFHSKAVCFIICSADCTRWMKNESLRLDEEIANERKRLLSWSGQHRTVQSRIGKALKRDCKPLGELGTIQESLLLLDSCSTMIPSLCFLLTQEEGSYEECLHSILSWRGVQDKEEAAQLFSNLIDELHGWRDKSVVELCALLGLSTRTPPKRVASGKRKGHWTVTKERPLSSGDPIDACIKHCAVFLCAPSSRAMFLEHGFMVEYDSDVDERLLVDTPPPRPRPLPVPVQSSLSVLPAAATANNTTISQFFLPVPRAATCPQLQSLYFSTVAHPAPVDIDLTGSP